MYPRGFGSSKELLKLQAEGKILSPLTPAASKWAYHQVVNGTRPAFHPVHSGTTPTMWVSATDFSYLIGMNNRRKTVAAVDTSKNGCYNATSVKVDQQRNVWVACQLNASFTAGAAQEYSSSGTLLNNYGAGCPSNIPASSCAIFFSGTVDQAESAQHVYVGLTFYVACDASYNCDQVNGGGVEYWNKGQASGQPAVNPFNLPGITLNGSGYLTVDASDNVYYTYVGCESANPSMCGYGLAEYANATSASGAQTVLLPPGSIGTFGGVTISDHGKIINVIDQTARTITQYALPWTGVPLRTLGPTLTPVFGVGDPVTGGFNRNDSTMVIGDAYGWLDEITVKTNTAKIRTTENCSGAGCQGATFTPSGK
jgi:hypothetical protein